MFMTLNTASTGFVTGLLLATTAISQARETVVQIGEPGKTIVGTLSLPEGSPAPVVLLLHGFTGSRDELGIPNTEYGVFSYTAEKLAQAGYASLRIDFRGSGESLADISFEDTTFTGQLEDAQAALTYLQGLEDVDADKTFVIGWSQGGLVAAGLAGGETSIDATALWQAAAFPYVTFQAIFGQHIVDKAIKADADDLITETLPWGAEVSLKGAFFDEFASFDPVAQISKYAGPLFVTTGSKDTIVTASAGQAFLDAHEGPEKLWAADMDHAFDIFVAPDTLDAMVAATIGFFNEYRN